MGRGPYRSKSGLQVKRMRNTKGYGNIKKRFRVNNAAKARAALALITQNSGRPCGIPANDNAPAAPVPAPTATLASPSTIVDGDTYVSPIPGPSKLVCPTQRHGYHPPHAVSRPQWYAKLQTSEAKGQGPASDIEETVPDQEQHVHQIASVLQLPSQSKGTTTSQSRDSMEFNSVSFCLQEKKKSKWLAPASSADSDIELDDDLDDTTLDPDFLFNSDDEELMSSGRSDATVVQPQDLPDENDEKEEDEYSPRKKKKIAHQRSWKKEDINHTPLQELEELNSVSPEFIRTPFAYFLELFSMDLIEHIVYQTNLYAKQRDANTTFSTDKDELLVFLGIVIYMSICSLPAIEDYWATETRVYQVADKMSSKRFKLMRSLLHFNDNEHAKESSDKFYKIRPIFNSITEQFLRVSATSAQNIDEVMVAYKGTKAGNLRQYVQYKPEKWGFKLFCRASVDGFIHDILMYQGETTFSSHHTELSVKESEMLMSSKTVISLLKTLENPENTAIYADNFFTNIELMEYMRQQYSCRYIGPARMNRVGNPPLKSVKEMEKRSVSRGAYDYTSSDGILALRWKDSKVITILSSDGGVEPLSTVMRYDKTAKAKVAIPCPNVIKNCNGNTGGINKSDMLTHLYKTPMRAKQWYLRLFGYTLDLCICNAWLLYKRDCQSLGESPMPLKNFRMDISKSARSMSASLHGSKITGESMDQGPITVPKRGQRAILPSVELRLDSSKHHMPIFVNSRHTCKHCSKKGDLHRSRWMCNVCEVALCLSDARNCFIPFHSENSIVKTSLETEQSDISSVGDQISIKEEQELDDDVLSTIPFIKQELDDDIQVKEEAILGTIHSVKWELDDNDVDAKIKAFPFCI